jgi:hypothetical protein
MSDGTLPACHLMKTLSGDRTHGIKSTSPQISTLGYASLAQFAGHAVRQQVQIPDSIWTYGL